MDVKISGVEKSSCIILGEIICFLEHLDVQLDQYMLDCTVKNSNARWPFGQNGRRHYITPSDLNLWLIYMSIWCLSERLWPIVLPSVKALISWSLGGTSISSAFGWTDFQGSVVVVFGEKIIVIAAVIVIVGPSISLPRQCECTTCLFFQALLSQFWRTRAIINTNFFFVLIRGT